LIRARRFLLALPLAGLLFTAGILGRGPASDPAVDPAAFARAATAPNADLAWIGILIGMFLILLGLWALYICLADGARERVACWGVILSTFGVAATLPLIGFMALGAPVVGRLYLAGQVSAIEAAVALANSGPALALMMLSGIAYVAGSILFAVVLRGALPRSICVAYALQAPLLSFVALFSVAAEALGAILLVISGAWIVWRAWRDTAFRVAYEPAIAQSGS
jgi:hypothetical protein